MRKQRHDRRHPHRLPAEAYREPGTLITVTFCRKAEFELAQPRVAHTIIAAAARIAAIHGMRIEAYCVMPDHVHIAVRVLTCGSSFEKWMRYTKRSSQEAVGLRGLWQRSFWDENADEPADAFAATNYILMNPVRQGLCKAYQEWPYSWSRWHPGTRGPEPSAGA